MLKMRCKISKKLKESESGALVKSEKEIENVENISCAAFEKSVAGHTDNKVSDWW